MDFPVDKALTFEDDKRVGATKAFTGRGFKVGALRRAGQYDGFPVFRIDFLIDPALMSSEHDVSVGTRLHEGRFDIYLSGNQ